VAKLSRGQVAGLAAVGALVALTGAALYSSRGGAPAPEGERAAETAPSAPTEAPITSSGTPSPESSNKEGASITAQVEEIMLSPQARILAERFTCVCGCKDILATCSCEKTPGSRDMKKYLQQLVDEGKAPADVEAAMIARYGEAAKP
jgi:hypothetical protein